MAKEVYNICFPHAECNAMKKQLIINILSFKVHTEVYDRYGDMEMADCLFTIDRKSRTLTMTDFHADSGEQSVVLDGGKMAKLLRYIVHTLEIFMWEQDYCLNPDGDDFFTDILLKEGIYVDDLGEKGEALPEEPEGRPSWQVHIEYSNHTVQDISGFDDYLPERPEELYLSFMEYFESDYEILCFISLLCPEMVSSSRMVWFGGDAAPAYFLRYSFGRTLKYVLNATVNLLWLS